MSHPNRRLLALAAAPAVALLMTASAGAQLPSGSEVTFEPGIDLQYEVLHTMDDPSGGGITAVDVAPDGRVFFTEVNGAVRVLDPDTGTVTTLATLLTSSMFCVTCPETSINEAGVHGIALAADFAATGHVYVSWAVAHSRCDVPANIAGTTTTAGETNAGCYRLSEFTVGSNELGQPALTDERVILTWPFSRFPVGINAQPVGSVDQGHPFRPSAHHGGGIDMLPDGSLVISVGDHTDPESSSGYGPRDPRPQRWWQNGERTSQNPADRRGKLLRVNPDGSAPADNPFLGQVGEYAFGTGPVPYDPYILAMGMRNPYKHAVDPLSGTVYAAQVGPDAAVDDPARGPAGVEELNIISRDACTEPTSTGACPYHAFNGGYPRCIGPGRAYVEYDYTAGASTGKALDCSSFDDPVLWYPKTADDPNPWPQLNGSGSTIIAGAVNRYAGTGPRDAAPLHDSLLLFDWSRSWLTRIRLAPDGTPDVSVDNVHVVARGFSGAVDAAIGPDGAVYVAEFGPSYMYNVGSRIGRIVCGGCGAQPASVPAVPVPAPRTAAWPVAAVVLTAGVLLAFGRRRRVA